MKRLLILLLLPLTVKAQSDTLQYRFRQAGRELEHFSGFATTGVVMQAGGIFLIGLGAITNQNHLKDPAGGSGKISGNMYIYAGLTAAMLGTLSFVAAGVHAGRAGHYLNSRGLCIPLDNRRRKQR